MESIDTPDNVYAYVSNIIQSSRIQLHYEILNESHIDDILTFVNTNYNDMNENATLVYSRELMEYYLIDSFAMFFYSIKNHNVPIGLIIGKYSNIMSFGKNIEALDGNFMCVVPQLRKLQLPKLLIAYLIKEGITRNTLPIKIGYYTTSHDIGKKPFCKKTFIHRLIRYKRKLYSQKFLYPRYFKTFTIRRNIENSEIEDITNRLNAYQKEHYDIYEQVSAHTIRNINTSNAFIKFIIIENASIRSFVSFYRLDTLNKNKKETIRTLYLHYYFSRGNIVHDLDYIAEYLYKNNMCDIFLAQMFDDRLPPNYFVGSGTLHYTAWNVKEFTIREHRVRLCVI